MASSALIWVPLHRSIGHHLWHVKHGKSKVSKGFGHAQYAEVLAHDFAPEAVFKGKKPVKYLKRVPYMASNGKQKYRYFYGVQHGGGIANADHYGKGTRFIHHHGHLEIHHVDARGRLHVHDSHTNETKRMSHAELTDTLSGIHSKEIAGHKEKLQKDVNEAAKHSDVLAKRIVKQAKRLGYDVKAPDSDAKIPEKAAYSDDDFDDAWSGGAPALKGDKKEVDKVVEKLTNKEKGQLYSELTDAQAQLSFPQRDNKRKKFKLAPEERDKLQSRIDEINEALGIESIDDLERVGKEVREAMRSPGLDPDGKVDPATIKKPEPKKAKEAAPEARPSIATPSLPAAETVKEATQADPTVAVLNKTWGNLAAEMLGLTRGPSMRTGADAVNRLATYSTVSRPAQVAAGRLYNAMKQDPSLKEAITAMAPSAIPEVVAQIGQQLDSGMSIEHVSKIARGMLPPGSDHITVETSPGALPKTPASAPGELPPLPAGVDEPPEGLSDTDPVPPTDWNGPDFSNEGMYADDSEDDQFRPASGEHTGELEKHGLKVEVNRIKHTVRIGVPDQREHVAAHNWLKAYAARFTTTTGSTGSLTVPFHHLESMGVLAKHWPPSEGNVPDPSERQNPKTRDERIKAAAYHNVRTLFWMNNAEMLRARGKEKQAAYADARAEQSQHLADHHAKILKEGSEA